MKEPAVLTFTKPAILLGALSALFGAGLFAGVMAIDNAALRTISSNGSSNRQSGTTADPGTSTTNAKANSGPPAHGATIETNRATLSTVRAAARHARALAVVMLVVVPVVMAAPWA